MDYLLSYKLITDVQFEQYKQYESSLPEDDDTSPRRIKIIKTQHTNHPQKGSKSPSPSAYDWSQGVSELSKLSGRVTWRAICDHLGIQVGGDSARRALKDWARENRRGWPLIPEP